MVIVQGKDSGVTVNNSWFSKSHAANLEEETVTYKMKFHLAECLRKVKFIDMYWKIIIMETSNVREKSFNKPKSNSWNFSQPKQ